MTHIFPILQSPSSCLSLDTFGITFYETRMKYVLAVSSARTVTMTRVRYSFFLCFIIYARVHYTCLYIYTHTHAYIFLLLFFLLRTSTPSEKAHAGTEGKGRIARSWNVGWRLIYTARGKSTKRNGSWLPRHDTL